jgi:hypothetical protein
MKKDLSLILIDIKNYIFIYILPIFIIYCFFLPYLISEIQPIQNPVEKELTYFIISQKYLNIFVVYYGWLLLRNYIESDLVETLMCLDTHYRIRKVFYAFVLYIIILIPYFIMTIIMLDHYLYLILGLVFEFIILICIFYGMTMLLKSCLITFVSLIIIILLFTQFFIVEEPYILFHPTLLTSQLPISYWIIQSCIGVGILIIGFLIEKKKLYMN